PAILESWNLHCGFCRFADLQNPQWRFQDSKVAETLNRGPVSPLRRGTAVERSDRQGVAHTQVYFSVIWITAELFAASRQSVSVFFDLGCSSSQQLPAAFQLYF